MTEPVLGSYYIFKYMSGPVYHPTPNDDEGIFIGVYGRYNIFASVLPNHEAANQPIQSVRLTYTCLNYYPIYYPSNKVLINPETYYSLINYIKSNQFKEPITQGRISPTVTILSDILLS